MSFKKVIGLILLFYGYHFAHSQTVAGNANLRILEAGLNNKIEIANEGISRKNLLVYCKDYKVVDSLGYFFVDIPYEVNHKKFTSIYIGDKKSKKNSWKDSVHFRIKQNITIVAQIGSLAPGEYNKWDFSIQAYIYALLPNFWYDGVKPEITNYTYHFRDFDDLLFVSNTIQGNSLSELNQYIRTTTSGAELIIDSIWVKLNGQLIQIPPIRYSIRKSSYESINRTNILLSKNEETIIYDPINNNVDIETYPTKKLVILNCNDTIVLLEQKDSAKNLLVFKKHYNTPPYSVCLENKRVSDTSFYVKYYNKQGTCLFEGLSLFPLIQFNEYNETQYTLTFAKPTDSLRHLCDKNNLKPFGEWRFYHNNGQLYAKGNFHIRIPMTNLYNNGSLTILFDDALPFNYFGKWFFYNTKGELINEETYKLSY